MIRLLLRWLVRLAWFACLPVAAAGLPWLDLSIQPRQSDLDGLITLLEDPGGRLTPQQALVADGWFHASPNLLNRGSSASAYWLSLALENRGSEPLTRWFHLGNPRLEYLDFYRFDPDGRWREHLAAGVARPHGETQMEAKVDVFALTLAPGERALLLTRVQGRTLLIMAPELWAPQAYRETEIRDDLLRLTPLVVAVVVGLYLLLNAAAHGERRHGLLGLWLLVAAAYQFAFLGYLRRYCLPDGGEWVLRAPQVLGLLSALVILVFLYDLLEMQRRRRWRQLYLGMMGALLLLVLFVMVGDLRRSIALSVVLLGAILLVLPFSPLPTWNERLHYVRFFVFSVLGIWLFQMVRLFRLMSPVSDMSWTAFYLVESYKLFMVLVLLLGAFRHNLAYRHASDALHASLLRAQQREQAQLERAVQQRSQALEQAVLAADEATRAKSELLARVGHDLRAPLTAIMGYAGLIVRMAGPSADLARGMERNAKRLLAQINGLIEYARGGAQSGKIKPQSLYASAFLRSLVASAERLASRNGNRLVAQLPASLPEVVELDPKRLRQVLEQLLDNAARFTRAGRIELRLDACPSVAPDRPGQWIFTVTDTGPGIPAQQLPHLFDPFQRLGWSDSHEGLGLGLLTAHQWVRNMGGSIGVESVLGQGTVVRVSIPVRISSEDCLQERHLVRDEREVPDLDGSGRRLWVVEDSRTLREMLGTDLRQQGFDVLALADGREAVARMEQPDEPAPDLILTDLNMPHADGWAVLAAAKRRWPGLPVLLISALGDMVQNQPHGFAAVLSKPLTLSELRRQLGQLLGLSYRVESVPERPQAERS